jgi:hypothetical protein
MAENIETIPRLLPEAENSTINNVKTNIRFIKGIDRGVPFVPSKIISARAFAHAKHCGIPFP